MADPISLLRQFVIDNKEYHLDNELYVFNDLAYPKDVKTNYLVYGFVRSRSSVKIRLIERFSVPAKTTR